MPVNLAYQSYQFIWQALDWLYPPDCGGCGAPGMRWCPECASKTLELKPPLCPECGNPNPMGERCTRCQSSPPFYTALRSHAVFSGSIRQALHRLKYRRDVGLGEALARPMVGSLKKLNWTLDVVTSVPLGLARFRERGYNQATLLARPIALAMRIPFSTRILSRKRETKSQVGLSVNERLQNMAGAFQANGDLARGKTILVVDDVATSGATINACAQALLEAGASKIYGFSLARAVFSPAGDVDLS